MLFSKWLLIPIPSNQPTPKAHYNLYFYGFNSYVLSFILFILSHSIVVPRFGFCLFFYLFLSLHIGWLLHSCYAHSPCLKWTPKEPLRSSATFILTAGRLLGYFCWVFCWLDMRVSKSCAVGIPLELWEILKLWEQENQNPLKKNYFPCVCSQRA